MATIKDIANKAGVSRGTVDRVLNHRGAVNAKTAEKVREAARLLQYTPNKAGIVLAAQKKKLIIGVILFTKGNPFFEEVMLGVNKKARELAGYNCSVLVKRVPFDVQAQLEAIDALVKEGVHGIVLTPYNAPEIVSRINQLTDAGIPFVTTNTDIKDSKRLAYVGSDYYHSGQIAGGLLGLMSESVKHVGIITGSSQVLCHTERIAGFKDCIVKRFPGIEIAAIVENKDDDLISYEKTKQLLLDHPSIDALYFTAAGVYGGCKALLTLPEKRAMKIVTYDSVDTTKELVKQGVISATICQQPLIQGSKPIDILFRYLTEGRPPKKEFYYIAADIRIQENI